MSYSPHQRRKDIAVRRPQTGKVVRADGSGIWVVPLGGDERYPIGPCRGGSGLVVNTIVLLIDTDQGPWVAGQETS